MRTIWLGIGLIVSLLSRVIVDLDSVTVNKPPLPYKTMSARFLFKQQSVSAEELSADRCPALKTNICQGSEVSRANMLVSRI